MAGQPPKVGLNLELGVQAACRHGIRAGWIHSAHDCAEGGLAIALAESCIGGQKGAAVMLPQGNSRLDTLLFGEGGARIIVSVSPAHQAEWEAYCAENCSECQHIGTVGDRTTSLSLSLNEETSLVSVSIADLAEPWANAIENALAVER